MRNISLLIATAALAGCTTAPQPTTVSAEGEANFQRLIAGKAAGPAVSCISRMRANDMTVIDDNRIAFRDGNRVYVNDFRGQGCSGAGSGFYTLVTRTSGSNLCSGDIAELVDARSGMLRSACILGDFTPYTRS